MHSLRSKITLLAVCMIVIAVTIVTCVSVFFLQNNERQDSEQILLLLCETGERNLDYYFNSVQDSVIKVSTFAEEDLDGITDEKLERHMDRVGKYFEEMVYKTNGVCTYYYRIDPTISKKVKGFWFTNVDGEGFKEHEVTDITQYDTKDTSKLVWFTVPKQTGKPVWLPPYITDNLDVRMISYNVPIYWKDRFVGVVGIEIEYSDMAKQVESIRLYNNGYAFLSDAEGNLFFHPRIDVTQLSEDVMPKVPDGLLGESTFLKYTFEGVEKQAAWLPLSNGMRLNVTVPVSETDGDWQKLIRIIVIVSLLVLLSLSLFTMIYTRRITKPLKDLTNAAEQVNRGNYDFELEYNGDDEVGRLTETFKGLAGHMKDHISDLNKRVNVDALTSVRNKGAFEEAIAGLQNEIVLKDGDVKFAIGIFDCDNLKMINDQFGHDKGDVYLKSSCRLICRVFDHSPVFRVGGDEFAVIMQGEDYENREELTDRFDKAVDEASASSENRWEKVSVAMGLAEYDPENDVSAAQTVRRADKLMYANKRERKRARSQAAQSKGPVSQESISTR